MKELWESFVWNGGYTAFIEQIGEQVCVGKMPGKKDISKDFKELAVAV